MLRQIRMALDLIDDRLNASHFQNPFHLAGIKIGNANAFDQTGINGFLHHFPCVNKINIGEQNLVILVLWENFTAFLVSEWPMDQVQVDIWCA